MLDLAIASGSFGLVSIVTFLKFFRESPELSRKRDLEINRALQNGIKQNPQISAAELLNILKTTFGFSRLKLVLAEIE